MEEFQEDTEKSNFHERIEAFKESSNGVIGFWTRHMIWDLIDKFEYDFAEKDKNQTRIKIEPKSL